MRWDAYSHARLKTTGLERSRRSIELVCQVVNSEHAGCALPEAMVAAHCAQPVQSSAGMRVMHMQHIRLKQQALRHAHCCQRKEHKLGRITHHIRTIHFAIVRNWTAAHKVVKAAVNF